MFGHFGEEALRSAAHHYDWKLSGKLEVCQECAKISKGVIQERELK
jgi:hypothetical protein